MRYLQQYLIYEQILPLLPLLGRIPRLTLRTTLPCLFLKIAMARVSPKLLEHCVAYPIQRTQTKHSEVCSREAKHERHGRYTLTKHTG